METNGLSLKSQEIGSKRKWETTADLSRRFCSNQHENPWEGGTTKHIACHSSGYQGHSSQEWPTWNGGSLTTSLGRQNDFHFCSNQHESPWEGGTTEHIACHSSWYQGHSSQEWPTRNGGSLTPSPGRQNDFHVSGDRFFLTSSPYQQDVESRYLQDKKNGVITCLVCGKEGHYSCNCRFKDQEHKIICTVCSKNGHCSMWCCQQNKPENRACTRCGEIGHSTSTHGLSCSSCDEHHDDGECRLSEVKCFLCECQDHYLAQCPLNSVLTAAFKGQRENFQAALRLALSKQGNPSSTPAKCSAKSEGKVLTANKSSPICFTCREEGHYARVCPQKFGAISGNTSKEVEESSTIATSSKMSKVLKEQDPGTAKQSSEMKPASVVGCVSCGQEGHRAKSCPTRVFTCYKCKEEGHTAKNCRQKQSEMKPKSNVHCVRCGEEGHRAKSCPTRVFTCYKCSEEGHTAKNCPQKQSSEMKPKSNVHCERCGEEGHWAKKCPLKHQPLNADKSSPLVIADNTPTRVVTCFRCKEEGHRANRCPQKHQKH